MNINITNNKAFNLLSNKPLFIFKKDGDKYLKLEADCTTKNWIKGGEDCATAFCVKDKEAIENTLSAGFEVIQVNPK